MQLAPQPVLPPAMQTAGQPLREATIRHRRTEQEMIVSLSDYLDGGASRYANWSLAGAHPSIDPPQTETEQRIAQRHSPACFGPTCFRPACVCRCASPVRGASS